MNFVDLILISDFGEYYFTIVSSEKLSKLISDGKIMLNGKQLTLKSLLEIETTTSEDAAVNNDLNKLKEVPEILLMAPTLIENGTHISQMRH